MRVKETVKRYLEEKLFVKVNQEKTKVSVNTNSPTIYVQRTL